MVMKIVKRFAILVILAALVYGGGRLYFTLTGGFTEGNITSDFAYDARWDSKPVTSQELSHVQHVLTQPYHWLGKGCQSYVFASNDGQYVIKFFKYQRFRNAVWLQWFDSIPTVDAYLKRKTIEKKQRLDTVFKSWKLAYEELPEESGIIFLHLNKSDQQLPTLVLYDKLGLVHHIDLNQTEFLLQKRADMLTSTLENLVENKQEAQAQALIDQLFAMIMSEYRRGYADNDHALMQNTGVFNGKPIHIDVGQFIKNKIMRDPAIYNQELYNKMYNFQAWLRQLSPALADHVQANLRKEIGEAYPTMRPYVYAGNVAKIPNE